MSLGLEAHVAAKGSVEERMVAAGPSAHGGGEERPLNSAEERAEAVGGSTRSAGGSKGAAEVVVRWLRVGSAVAVKWRLVSNVDDPIRPRPGEEKAKV